VQSTKVSTQKKSRNDDISLVLARSRLPPLAMAIPGYGLAEQVIVGGFSNFLSIYNAVITARILLSWFPQAQGVAVLQPIYAVTDPYLNLFRGIIPPIGGFDLSPLAAFFVLNVAGQVTAAIGCEVPTAKRGATSFAERRPRLFQQMRKLQCLI